MDPRLFNQMLIPNICFMTPGTYCVTLSVYFQLLGQILTAIVWKSGLYYFIRSHMPTHFLEAKMKKEIHY